VAELPHSAKILSMPRFGLEKALMRLRELDRRYLVSPLDVQEGMDFLQKLAQVGVLTIATVEIKLYAILTRHNRTRTMPVTLIRRYCIPVT